MGKRSLVQQMGEEEGSWDNTVEEWLISEGYCCGAALAYKESCEMFAAAPIEGEKGWGVVYAEPKERDVDLEGDGNSKKLLIVETEQLKKALETKRSPPGGLYLGGVKYMVTQARDEEVSDKSIPYIFATRPKAGVHICTTPNYVILAFYNEEQSQTAGNAKKAILVFAEYIYDW